MQIGTAEIDVDDPQPRRKRLSHPSSAGHSSGGRGKNGGDGNNGGGGGSNGPRHDETAHDDINRDKSRVISWFLLLVVLMTFGGLIGAYIVIATNGAIEWKPFNL